MSVFLSSEDLAKLTGYVRSADQIRWLRRKGYVFEINAKNEPVVPSDVLNKGSVTHYELGEVR